MLSDDDDDDDDDEPRPAPLSGVDSYKDNFPPALPCRIWSF